MSVFRYPAFPLRPSERLSRFELAILAALVSSAGSMTPAQAVGYAFDLWTETEKHFAAKEIADKEDFEIKLDIFFDTGEPLARDRALEVWRKTAPKPGAFPARLDDFFRLVIKAKTPADCTKRLRDFFRDCYCRYGAGGWGDPRLWGTQKPDTEAAEWIGKLTAANQTEGCFKSERHWTVIAGSYQDWWRGQKAAKARVAAKYRGGKRGT